MNDLKDILWLAPWKAVSPEDREPLENELKREVRAGHPLHKAAVIAIGRRQDCDDVVFEMLGSAKIAVVHLTWGPSEPNPAWPYTEVFDNFESWAEERMKSDSKEWQTT